VYSQVEAIPEYDLKPMSAPQKKRFKELSPIGFTAKGATFKKSRPNNKTFDTRFVQFETAHPQDAEVIKNLCQHSEVGYDPKRQAAQEAKMDAPAVHPDSTDPFFIHAQELTYQMYEACLVAPLTAEFSVVDTAASGYPYSHLGFPTKGVAKTTELHKKLLADFPAPLAQSFPKGSEALPDDELAEGKLRTVCLTPLFFIDYQKFFFEAQNIRMKMFHDNTWGKYGYVKQYGGFHRLFSSLQPWEIIWEADISGWDRKIFLFFTYEARLRGLCSYYGVSLPKGFSSFLTALFSRERPLDAPLSEGSSGMVDPERLRKVIFNCIFPVVIMGDGTVWRRKTGNNSGSNNTTTDNTYSHTLINVHLAVILYYQVHQELPTLAQVKVIMNCLLFGDDTASGGLALYFPDTEKEVRELIQAHYARYGLLIKDKAFKVLFKRAHATFSGISFLGATAQYEKGSYVPYPRVSKIAYSLSCVMNSGQVSDAQLADRIAAIWDLISYCSSPDLQPMKKAVIAYAKFYYKQLCANGSTDLPAVSQKFQFVLTNRVNFPLYKGYEAQSKVLFFPRTGGRRYKSASMNNNNELPLGKAPRKTRALINNMLVSKTITPEAMKWLIVATDPFHDEPVACEGYPDLTTSSVITQTIQLTTALARPATVPATDSWDASIFFNPVWFGVGPRALIPKDREILEGSRSSKTNRKS